jgi:hypothetical protein
MTRRSQRGKQLGEHYPPPQSGGGGRAQRGRRGPSQTRCTPAPSTMLRMVPLPRYAGEERLAAHSRLSSRPSTAGARAGTQNFGHRAKIMGPGSALRAVRDDRAERAIAGTTDTWICFQNTLDIPIYWDPNPIRPVPPRGRARGVQVCGAAEGGAGDAALAFGVLAGSTPAGADAVALFGATRHRVRRPKPCGPGAPFRAPLGINGDPCASGAIAPAGPCRGTRICPTSGG